MNLARRKSAFTLVEVLVALGLASMLAVAVQALMTNAYRASRSVEIRRAAAARGRLPLDLLRRDLEAVPAGFGLTLREGVLEFVTLNALQWSRNAARHAVNVRYATAPRDGADSVVLRRAERPIGAEGPWKAGIPLATAGKAEFEAWDGRLWNTAWPPPGGASARALRMRLTQVDGTMTTKAVALAPLEWARHGR